MEEEIGIVFCRNCRAIISTDAHLLQEVVEKGVLVFAKCSVDICKDILVSHDSFDKYCTYQQLLCRGCHHPVGRIYRALNDELIDMLNKYIVYKSMLVFGVFEDQSLHQKPKQEEPIYGKIEVEIDVKKYDPLIPGELLEYYERYYEMKKPIHYALHMCTKFSKQLAEFDARIEKLEFDVQSLYRKYLEIKNKQTLIRPKKKGK